MTVSAVHHPAFRVADIGRAGQFYIDALGGHWRVEPFEMSGPDAEMVMGGLPGCVFKVGLLGFEEGTIELFQFLEPVHPTETVPQERSSMMHYAFYVDDVPGALERVERAGGRRYWPDVQEMNGFQVVYVTDPDGVVLELIDIAIDPLVRVLNG